ncbi:MAG: SUMF1/EgtB/PvdO family nonheme iron enzyme, partial [Verrucomicrobiae bacterium]|nr:SUMF1/EgtB/PvdO family nonheme iron enzyme [Verrucomicrobiae bacterium]
MVRPPEEAREPVPAIRSDRALGRWLSFGVAWILMGLMAFPAEPPPQEAGHAVVPGDYSRSQPFTNSLGMQFVPVPGTGVLFSVWETRVRDFRAFVEATGHDATGKMYSIGPDGWKLRGRTWKDPGFHQSPSHPVCGVSFGDATRFCEWLTGKERTAGVIGAGSRFRLPTDAEWSAAVGGTLYPWGNEWPPPP